jgi:hypothetical protein
MVTSFFNEFVYLFAEDNDYSTIYFACRTDISISKSYLINILHSMFLFLFSIYWILYVPRPNNAWYPHHQGSENMRWIITQMFLIK